MSTGGTFLTAEAIQIVQVNEEAHSFRLAEEELTRIILKDNIKNRDVVIVSVAGAFRKGKSFLLDFFLRYLYARVRQNVNLTFETYFNSIFSFLFSTSIKMLTVGWVRMMNHSAVFHGEEDLTE